MKPDLTNYSPALHAYLTEMVRGGKRIPQPCFSLLEDQIALFIELIEIACAVANASFLKSLDRFERRKDARLVEPKSLKIVQPSKVQIATTTAPATKQRLPDKPLKTKLVKAKRVTASVKVPYKPITKTPKGFRPAGQPIDYYLRKVGICPVKRVWITFLQGGAPGLGKRA